MSITTNRVMDGEQLYSLAAIAVAIPGHRGNAHANAATVFRWVTKGVRTATGEVVRLEAVRLGTAWRSSHEAVARFCERLTAAAAPRDALVPVPESPRQLARKQSDASAKLDALLGG